MNCSILSAHARAVGRRFAKFIGGAALLAALGLASHARPALAQQELTDTAITEALIGDAIPAADFDRNNKVKDAIERFKNKDFSGARDALVTAKTENTKLPPVGVMMAKLYFLAKQVPPQYGLGELEKTVATDPNDPEAYLILGDLEAQQGHLTAADALFAKAELVARGFSKENPGTKRGKNFAIKVFAGQAFVAEGREHFTDARELINRWIALDPSNPAPELRLGRVLFKLKDVPGATEAFTKAHTLAVAEKKDGNDKGANVPDPNVSLGQMYLADSKTRPEAIRAFTAAASKPSATAETLLQATTGALQAKDTDDAIAWSALALQREPNSDQAKYLSALAARLKGDYPAAERLLEDLHAANPSNPDVTNQLALVLAETKGDAGKKKREIGLDYAKLNVERNPKNPEVQTTYAWVLYKNDQKTEAAQRLGEILRQTQQLSPDSAYYLAVMQKEPEDALKSVTAALKANAPFFVHEAEAKALFKSLGGKDSALKADANVPPVPPAAPATGATEAPATLAPPRPVTQGSGTTPKK